MLILIETKFGPLGNNFRRFQTTHGCIWSAFNLLERVTRLLTPDVSRFPIVY